MLKLYVEKESVSKSFVNNLVSKLASECENLGKIIVLDGPELRTSSALINKNIDASRIQIAEHNPDTFKLMFTNSQRLFPNTILNVYYCPIVNLLKLFKETGQNVSVLYLDWMHSSLKSDDYESIMLLFAMCTNKTVLCVNFCIRSAGAAKMKIQKLVDYIYSCGEIYTKKVQMETVYGYKRTHTGNCMCFIAFKIGACWEKTEVTYRPKKIEQRVGNDVLVSWWLYPKQVDWTWENADSILIEDDDIL